MKKIALAVGGVDPLRTYTRWRELAEMLEARFDIEWTLLGSSNGLSAALDFVAASGSRVVNLTGKTSLTECRQLIHEQDFFIACDGGLMHLAVTTDVKLIALFNGGVKPEWRLPPDLLATALISPTASVEDIEPGRIVKILETTGAQRRAPVAIA